jgi:hypothetical protein
MPDPKTNSPAPEGCAALPGSPLWSLDGRMGAEMAKAKAGYVPPTGTKIEQAREIIRRCEELDIKLCAQAIEAENAGDHEACWMNMATRAHNTRFLERVRADLQSLENDPGLATAPKDSDS